MGYRNTDAVGKGLSLIICAVSCCLLGLLLPASTAAQQISIRVASVLQLGTIFRSGQSIISYGDNNAAMFIVEGEPSRSVHLVITSSELSYHGIDEQSGEMRLDIMNEMCAYSRDGGVTWNQFATGYLSQDVAFSGIADAGANSSIYVRVGGSIAASGAQQRGTYSGNITLNAFYNE